MSAMPLVRVNRKGAERIDSGHMWIFASDVLDAGSAGPGTAVRVADPKGRQLGVAHYSSTSQIALRFLSRRVEEINTAFLRARIEAALAYRRKIVGGSDAYRLIHAEGDLLPGLIVDRYSDYLVIQFLDQGMDALTGEIVDVLQTLLSPRGIVARNDVPVRTKESLPLEIHTCAGEIPEEIEVHLSGLTCRANLLKGQKTGVFLDQRENYLAARRYASGRALDCFCAMGGFALHLASVCESVEGVDSSQPTLELAEKNAQINGLSNIEFRKADVLEFLPGLVAARRKFDIVIVDPPAFTKSRGAIEGAARGYKEINLRALRLLDRGGVLVSCSCSHHMSEAHLLELVAAAALDCGKQLRVIERRTQSQDHPILLTVPETYYLKCLIFEVL
ncbi:MAG TPA: class I SAM-dependent rRNA methyltransferase [Bryobacteraceae bacterium]|nr:class I SAM-dependent rRNA methyltransferase [Bryobacteraceae bacterium]